MNYTLKSVLESVLIAVISTFVAIILFFIPVLNIAVLLFPVPFIVIAVRRGIWAGMLSVAISAILFTVILHPILGLMIFVFNVLLVWALWWVFSKRMQMNECIIFSSASILASVLINFQIFSWIVGQNFFDFLWEKLEQFFVVNSEAMKAVIELYQRLGILDRIYSVEEFAQIFVGQLKGLLPLLPSALLIFSTALGLIIFLLTRYILKRLKLSVPFVPQFIDWALPKGTGRGFLAIMIIAIMGIFIGIPSFDVVFYTISALFSFIFTIQGLATADFFLKLGNLSKIVRIFILIAVFIFMSPALTFVGVIEQIFNFRRAYSSHFRQ